MNAPRVLLLPVLVGGLVAGCHPDESEQRSDVRATGPGHTDVIAFTAKSGLLVPSEVAQRIGLKIGEVEERKITFHFRFSAVVYNSAAGRSTAWASALLGRGEAEKLRAGLPIQVQTGEGAQWAGRLAEIQREQSSGPVEVQMEIEGGGGKLAPGKFVTVTGSTVPEQGVPSVPRSALVQNVEGWSVYVVNGGHFLRTAVRVGRMDEAFAEITDGLHEGDQVAVQGGEALWLSELKFTKAGAACCSVDKK